MQANAATEHPLGLYHSKADVAGQLCFGDSGGGRLSPTQSKGNPNAIRRKTLASLLGKPTSQTNHPLRLTKGFRATPKAST